MAKNCIGDFEFDDMPRTRGEWRELTERFKPILRNDRALSPIPIPARCIDRHR